MRISSTIARVLLSVAVAGAAVSVSPAGDVQALVEEAALEVAEGLVPVPDRFDVESVRFGGADPIPDGDVRLTLQEVTGPNASGVVQIRFGVRVDGTPRGVARATARGTVRGPAVVALETLRGGEVVDPSRITVEETDLTRYSGEILRHVEDVTGLVPVRSLGTGRVLTDELMRPMPVVRRGDPINLTVRRGRLTVTAQGVARKDGAPGETITAVNTSSGKELVGLVLADGSVEIVQGPRARRTR